MSRFTHIRFFLFRVSVLHVLYDELSLQNLRSLTVTQLPELATAMGLYFQLVDQDPAINRAVCNVWTHAWGVEPELDPILGLIEKKMPSVSELKFRSRLAELGVGSLPDIERVKRGDRAPKFKKNFIAVDQEAVEKLCTDFGLQNDAPQVYGESNQYLKPGFTAWLLRKRPTMQHIFKCSEPLAMLQLMVTGSRISPWSTILSNLHQFWLLR